jgi:hypothetical protein
LNEICRDETLAKVRASVRSCGHTFWHFYEF